MRKYFKSVVILCLLLVLVGIPRLQANWVEDGVAICTELDDQMTSEIVSDGLGGAIVAWTDYRSGAHYDIYAQRVNASGYVQWITDGAIICSASGSQHNISIVSDGMGGAIITWQDERSAYDIYTQRVDSWGSVQWTADGVLIGAGRSPLMVSDGSGGAIIAWENNYNIYAQRVDALGVAQWTGGGVSICTNVGDQSNPTISSDESNGAVISWGDNRNGNYDIYAQRVDASGSVVWSIDGVEICAASGDQLWSPISSDGSGGAIMVWRDCRNSGDCDIYAQRITAFGSVQWTPDGIPICAVSGDQSSPDIVSDGLGGAIITWIDARSGSYDIYTQRVDATGTVQWTADGIAVCTAPYEQFMTAIVSDGSGGAIITWGDYRDGSSYDIYAQKVGASGIVHWMASGVAITTASNNQTEPAITSNGSGGAIITWNDYRNGSSDIYAQLIGRDGRWGSYPAPTISAVQDVPKDQGGKILLQWERSSVDSMPSAEISHYSVWRRVPKTEVSSFTEETQKTWPLDVTIDFAGPAMRFYSTSGDSAWEWLANVPARHFETYALTVQSLYDSIGTDPGWQYFMISAHTNDPIVYYDSPVDSGYSVDNLSPCQPEGLTGEAIYGPPGCKLSWEPNSEPDLACYAIYRGESEVFVPAPENLISSACCTAYLDDYQWWDRSYYKVSAIDIHGNKSQFALLRPEDVSGSETSETPLAFCLAQNYPNPFNPVTTIAFGIKERGHVSLHVYDAAGRLVTTLLDEVRPAGNHIVEWRGHCVDGSSAASGVYFYRLRTGAFEQTRKMILMR